jgi:putative membrane protein
VNEPSRDTERTQLASERTQLAWWRTGLAALAVSLAVERLVPELSHASSQWPYTVIGVGFALYGLVLVANRTLRAREVEKCLSRGDPIPPQGGLITGLSVAATALAIATGPLIILQQGYAR